jgi:hypothetical protein
MADKFSTGVLVCMLLMFAGGLDAQQGAPRRVPVTIVLMERLAQADAPFVIERRPNLAPRDVIVMRADATADQLSDAVRSLLTIRQASGDTAATQATMRMRRQSAAAQNRRAFPWVRRVLADLRQAPEKHVPGIGRARAVEIWLPAQTRRGGPR